MSSVSEKKFSLSFTKAQWLEMAKTASVLVAIAAIVALLLSGVNEVTAPRIALMNEQATKDAMAAVLPADDYRKIDKLNEICADPIVSEAYTALKANEKIGYCIKVAPQGFGGKIEMVVGIEAGDELKVSRVHIVSLSETPGLGTKVQDDAFIEQFEGKKTGVKAVSSSATGENEISAIAGATVSSKAATSGVAAAMSAAEMIKGAENNG